VERGGEDAARILGCGPIFGVHAVHGVWRCIAPVTRDVAAVKTDATVWASRIVAILDNLEHVEQLAAQLKHDLRTDELTRQTHDNFYSECLGAILL